MKFAENVEANSHEMILLYHDNAKPHTARTTQGRIQAVQWELLEYPPYRPDLAPNDFHLFGLLNNHLGDKRFADDEKAEKEVQMWLRQHSKDLYAAGFDALVKRWDKCINVDGGYVAN
jgi:hypothetical protein